MNLFQVVEYLLETGKFSIKDLLILSFWIFGNERVSLSTDPLHPNSPYTPLGKGNPVGELVQTFINSRIATCSACSRCKCSKHDNRTNVVMPDGFYDADIFVVTDYPSIADDKTGIPLSGPFEIKSSNCIKCKNFTSCLDSGYTNQCSFIPGDLNNLKNSDIKFPGRILSDTLSLNRKDPTEFTSTRASWSPFLRAVASDPETFDKWNVRPRIYVTSMVKCYGSALPTEEEVDECIKWLYIERTLSTAPITLVLGNTVYNKILGTIDGMLEWEEALNHVQEDQTWGKIICYHAPDNIIPYRDTDLRTYKHMLGELDSKLRETLSLLDTATTSSIKDEDLEAEEE